MNKLVLAVLFTVGQYLVKGSEIPADAYYSEGSSQIQDQAQQDYSRHQQELQSQENRRSFDAHDNEKTDGFQKTSTDDGAISFQFDRQGPSGDTRDRGYGYEKAYAYSRETAFVEFDADKAVVNAKDLVESDGNIDYSQYTKSNQDLDVNEHKSHYYRR